MTTTLRVLALLSAAVVVGTPAWGQNSAPASPAVQEAVQGEDPLLEAFREPPSAARPRVWWHWMDGNITQEGIRKDLEWMKRIGIGGFQNFDAGLQTPQIVDKRLAFMTPEWKAAFRFAASEANQLGLEMAIASSPGWSETGGPWVAPRDGMKKVVWSQVTIPGGKRFSGRLPSPPHTTGPFQNVPALDVLARLTGVPSPAQPELYGDIAVLAVPVDRLDSVGPSGVTGPDGAALDAAALRDGDMSTAAHLPLGSKEKPSTITYAFAAPQTVRSATLFIRDLANSTAAAGTAPVLEASDDGRSWSKVADIPVTAVPATVAFAPVTGRYFRVVFNAVTGGPSPLASLPPGIDLSGLAKLIPAPPSEHAVAEFSLSAGAAIDQYERKAGFALVPDYFALAESPPDNAAGIDPRRVIDLTGRVTPDGTLRWTPPRGNWRIIRLGWSLLGTTNHPATAEATGLEVDKYDSAAVRRYLDHYLAMYRDAAGSDLIGKRGVQALLTDSTEVGPSNWTPRMVEQFTRLRGYDPTPYLPALTGLIIGSRADSERFLFDYRRTLTDLVSSEHYGTVAEVAHANGLTVYGEALEGTRATLGDDMTMRSHTDVPMAALWTFPEGTKPALSAMVDMKGAASVANIYGQNLAAAESMTAVLTPWGFAPHHLRRAIDLEFATGINRPVIHTSVHQPRDDRKPGLSLSIFGQYFNRHETWAELARPWIDYMARNSFMLQQGRAQADVAYFYGEEAPLGGVFTDGKPDDRPTRYGYDFASADVLTDQLSVEGNELVAKGGARYRLLYLGGSSRFMSLDILRRVAALADAGAVVAGDAPIGPPGLNDDPAEYARIVRRLWSGSPVTEVGKGRVIAGRDIEAALAVLGLAPDFDYVKPRADSEILFAHRRLADGDAYFVNNRQNRAEHVEARFRVTGKTPEIWRADTGTTESVSYRIEGGVTVVPLDFTAEDSFFVVFRKPATAPAMTLAAQREERRLAADRPWRVAFETGRGAPREATLTRLAPLNQNANPGIRYFSGIATYTTDIVLPAAPRAGEKVKLDLGAVGDIAEVRVNGSPVGTAWHAPWTLDVSGAVKRGRNRIEVRVANLWVNRLIGDQQPGATKVAYTGVPTYTAAAPLQPAGLIGPVALVVSGP
jgi:hypothetical protein